MCDVNVRRLKHISGNPSNAVMVTLCFRLVRYLLFPFDILIWIGRCTLNNALDASPRMQWDETCASLPFYKELRFYSSKKVSELYKILCDDSAYLPFRLNSVTASRIWIFFNPHQSLLDAFWCRGNISCPKTCYYNYNRYSLRLPSKISFKNELPGGVSCSRGLYCCRCLEHLLTISARAESFSCEAIVLKYWFSKFHQLDDHHNKKETEKELSTLTSSQRSQDTAGNLSRSAFFRTATSGLYLNVGSSLSCLGLLWMNSKYLLNLKIMNV